MPRRMRWDEIVANYPESWVRLEEVEHAPGNDATVVSAVVTRVGDPSDQDIVDAMNGQSEEKYTYGGSILRVGGLTA